MALGKLSVPGRPTIWKIVGQGPIALAVGEGGGCLDIFILLYLFSSLSPSLWETARYRLKYCLKGPINPKQPTNLLVLRMGFDCISSWSLRIFLLYMVTQQARILLIKFASDKQCLECLIVYEKSLNHII